MFQLRLGQRTNVLYNLAKGIGTLRADGHKICAKIAVTCVI